jgi:DNA polymerase III delta prime subunit
MSPPVSHHTFDTLWGLEPAKALVRRLVETGRLPHALLVHGADGLGKRSFAFAAAKLIISSGLRTRAASITAPGISRMRVSLDDLMRSQDDLFGGGGDDLFGDLAEEPEEKPPAPPPPVAAPKSAPRARAGAAPVSEKPPEPRSFAIDPRVHKLVSKSYPPEYDKDDRPMLLGHVDLNIIEPVGRSRSIKVDQIRFLQDMAWIPPLEGETRVILIFGADTITVSAANSILKVLEEPPSYLVMILVTDHYQRVLETIRSRCSVIACQPMARGDLVSKLVGEERVDPSVAKVAAAISEGRPGQALALLEAGLLKQRQEVFEARLAIDRTGIEALPAAAARALAAGGSLGGASLLLLALTRDRMVRQVAERYEDLLVNGDLAALLDSAPLDPALLHEEGERLLEALRQDEHPAIPAPQIPLELALWPG